VDGIVFTAGIGEHDAAVRAGVCAGLGWLGLVLDGAANQAGGTGRISAEGSRVEAWVVPTDEEAVIAGHVASVLSATAPLRAGQP